MKILTKEEEEEHYAAVLKGGISGGLVGLGIGLGAAALLNRRWQFFRSLTLPLKAFFVTSTGTFAAIINADVYSRNYESSRHAELREYKDSTARALARAKANTTNWEKFKDFGRENRYPIVTASWIASMALSLGLVSRNKYLTPSQKLVQARMYAQGLSLAVLVATAGFEVADARSGKGKFETVLVVDPEDPEHKHMIQKKIHHESYSGEDLWKDMVESEERRLKEREAARTRAKAD
ncbi:hypothetical protein L873DRAFT_1802129 [Choiromyces venosus 120613-1]|uniref:HIG1 domain-containing protein n=1 Tax=Choiromyces venosus 120613-1 TaxID=1336337 RepID=A0A3N4JWB9_9PEZI|nr:hypothetical protein L873DRAFT_1802129 [Choiromyces venosus 120613-1]